MPNHIFEYIRKWEKLPETGRGPIFQEIRVNLNIDLNDKLYSEISQYVNELSAILSSDSSELGTFDQKYRVLLAAIAYKIDVLFEDNSWRQLGIFKNKNIDQAKYELARIYLDAIIAKTPTFPKTLIYKGLIHRPSQEISEDPILTAEAKEAQIKTNEFNLKIISEMSAPGTEKLTNNIETNLAKLNKAAEEFFKIRFFDHLNGVWNAENEFRKHQEYNLLMDLEYYLSPQHIHEAFLSTEFVQKTDGTEMSVRESVAAFDSRGRFKNDPKFKLYTPERVEDFIKRGNLDNSMSLRERLVIGGAISVANDTISRRAFAFKQDGDPTEQLSAIRDSQNIIVPGVLIQLTSKGPLRLASPNANELSSESKENILQLKFKYKYEFLLQNLYVMKDSYKLLKRSSNTKKIDALIENIESLQKQNMSHEDVYNKAREELLKAFEYEQKSLNFGFIHKRSKADFISKINNDTRAYHYPRLLALALKKTYIDSYSTSKLPVNLGLFERTEAAMMAVKPVEGNKFYKRYDFNASELRSLVKK